MAEVAASVTAGPGTSAVVIVDVVPAHASFGSGESWGVRVDLLSSTADEFLVSLEARSPGAIAVRASVTSELQRGPSSIDLTLTPPTGARAWQLIAVVSDAQGTEVARAVSGADVLDDWRTDPRYGFLCDFAPGAIGIGERVERMARYHLTCVQLYDWAWRHHELLAPDEPYADVLGKPMSLASVTRAIDACHDQRMAALGYATVYAAEQDFLQQHPDWGLYDDGARPWQLADLFFLMDPRPGSPWSRHMLGQLEFALGSLPIDGFHLDQYGYPRVAQVASGEQVDVAAGFAAFVTEANGIVSRSRPLGGSIFNNVNAWPLEGMAGTADIATYIEVWPPYTEYRDLVDLVRRAQRSDPDVPVIVAAYAGLLTKTDDADEAAAGLALLAAVVLAAGAWPLLVGEGDRVLTGGYYPEHVAPPERAQRALRAVLDAGVAWRELLRGPGLTRVADAFIDGQDSELNLDVPWSSRPMPGHVWVSLVIHPDHVVVSLVNLLDTANPRWNQPQAPHNSRSVSLRLPQGIDKSGAWVAGTAAAWEPATVDCGSEGASVTVALDVWSLVIFSRTKGAC